MKRLSLLAILVFVFQLLLYMGKKSQILTSYIITF